MSVNVSGVSRSSSIGEVSLILDNVNIVPLGVIRYAKDPVVIMIGKNNSYSGYMVVSYDNTMIVYGSNY